MPSVLTDAIEMELRTLSCNLGTVIRPDGSVTLTQGDTAVLAAVYGPGEVKILKELSDKSTIEVVWKPKSGLPACSEKFYERMVRNICETAMLAVLYPRSSIVITIQELQNSGSLLSTAINAACLALLHAGVSMTFTMAAVTVIVGKNNELVLDPNWEQEETALTSMTFVFEDQEMNTVAMFTKGSYTNEQFQKCLLACRQASKIVFQFYRDSFKNKLSKSL